MVNNLETPIKALIVDDENKACTNLESMLLSYTGPGLEVVGFAHDTIEAEAQIKRLAPDIVFLDIHMPHGNVFTMLEKLSPLSFEVIFVTAFDEYAVKAFRLNALHYILKPISIAELLNAVNKLKEKIGYKRFMAKVAPSFAEINEQVNNKQQSPNITFKGASSVEIVSFRDIFFIEAQSSYSRILFTKDKQVKELTMSNPLSEYEEILPVEMFFRIHKSYLVNCSHIKCVENKDAHFLVLNNDTELPISRRRYGPLLEFLRANKYHYV